MPTQPVTESESSGDIPVVIIFGPTASGKTALAERLFVSAPEGSPLLPFGAGIVSADSMQVYRGLDTGTAKPSSAVTALLPHYLIDIRSPGEQFTAGDFVRCADEACAALWKTGTLPVVLGGTAFYIKNFLYGLPETPGSEASVRESLRRRMDEEGAAALWNELAARDPASASRIHVNDEYRILRALEVFTSSGRPLSSFDVPETFRPGYRFLVLGIDRPREELYERIDARVDEMFTDGLREEVLGLIRSGYGADDPGMQAIGYREFFMTGVPPEDADTEAVKTLVKRDTRRYAKRQFTFFKAIEGVRWFSAADTEGVAAAIHHFME